MSELVVLLDEDGRDVGTADKTFPGFADAWAGLVCR